MDAMLSAAPMAIGERSRSFTVRSSARIQPLSSYRLPIVSATGVERTTASVELPGSTRIDVAEPQRTAASGAAVPRTTVQLRPAWSKEAWKRGVAAWAANAAKIAQTARNIESPPLGFRIAEAQGARLQWAGARPST